MKQNQKNKTFIQQRPGWRAKREDDLLLHFVSVQSVQLFVLFEVFNLLVCVVDLEIHLVHFIHQRINGVVLVLNLRLETKSKVLQSAQAIAHLI